MSNGLNISKYLNRPCKQMFIPFKKISRNPLRFTEKNALMWIHVARTVRQRAISMNSRLYRPIIMSIHSAISIGPIYRRAYRLL